MGWMRRTAGICAGFAALALLGCGLARVREVRVIGAVGESARQVMEASGMELGDWLLNLDWKRAENGINALGGYAFERGSATIMGRAVLEVRARESAAMLAYGSGVIVVDGDMYVMELRQDAPDRDAIFISGVEIACAQAGEVPEMEADQLAACRAALHAVEACGARGFVSEINLSDAENMELISASGARVLLGDGGALEEKLTLARAAMQDIERRGEGGGTLDVAGRIHADYRPAAGYAREEALSGNL